MLVLAQFSLSWFLLTVNITDPNKPERHQVSNQIAVDVCPSSGAYPLDMLKWRGEFEGMG